MGETMKFVKPSVYLIASTSVHQVAVERWLGELGASGWSTDKCSDAELLIELSGRRCYKAFGTDLNPNISKVRKGNTGYINNILKSRHGSVLEHAHVTFAIENVSRVFTHELVRHRLCNFSQESLRFVRPTSLDAYFPEVYTDHLEPEAAERVRNLFSVTFKSLEILQQKLIEICGMDKEGLPFGVKKLIQSANRRLMPIGMSTAIIVTSNHRNWRHLIEMRTASFAEEEIRVVFSEIAGNLRSAFPAIYQDMQVSDDGITFEHGRV